jgi:hypothetical protein
MQATSSTTRPQQDGLCLRLPPNSKASLAAAKADASKKALLAQAKQEAQAAKAAIAAAKRKALQEEQAERQLAALGDKSAEETTTTIGRGAQRQKRSASKVRDSQCQCCTTRNHKHLCHKDVTCVH